MMRLYYDLTVRDANRLLAAFILFELGLILIFVANKVFDNPLETFRVWFDLAGEGTIPAWFSSVQLCLIGLVFVLGSRLIDPSDSPSPLFFRMVGAGFIFLSADEAASIHEGMTLMLRGFEWIPRFKGGRGIWVFIYLPIGFILFLATSRKLLALWRRYRRPTCIMAIGVAIYLLAAVGLEVIGFQFLRSGTTPLLYKAELVLEEFLEMAGASIILYGAMLWVLEEVGSVP